MKHFYKVAVIWFALIVLGIIAIALIPNKYQVRATLLPVQQKSGPSFGNIGNSLAASFLGAEASSTSSSVIRSVLGSQTLLRDVVLSEDVFADLARKPHIKEAKERGDSAWERSQLPALVSSLKSMVNVIALAEGPILIDVVSASPDLSANIAEAHINSLRKMLKDRTSSQAKRKREFTERLVQEKRMELNDLRKKLLNFDAEGNIQNLAPELLPLIVKISELERKRSSLRMQKDFLDKYSALDNESPLSRTLEGELKNIEASIQKTMESAKKSNTELAQSGVSRPSGRIPLVAFEYQVTQAEVEVLSEVVQTLERELEMLKIEEVSDEISFQVLDKPIPTDLPIYPRKRQMAILWMFFVSFIGLLYLFKKERIHYIAHKLRVKAEESLSS